MQPKKNESGYYYDHLPEEFRIAAHEDFYNDDGKLLTGKAYLVKSYHNGEKYQAYRTTSTFNIRKIAIWLDDSRVFVLR